MMYIDCIIFKNKTNFLHWIVLQKIENSFEKSENDNNEKIKIF